MKKLLSFLLTLVLVISIIPLGAFSFDVSAATSGYYTYGVSDGEATITGVSTSISGAVTIPSTLGGCQVISIGDSAFFDCLRLDSVTIPDSVTNIGDSAFYGCSRLTSVTIGNSVTSIGDSAFAYCTSLTSITIPDSVTSIGNEVFARCENLTSITIGDGVTSIGYSAFYSCESLNSVTIGNSVTSIGNAAFSSCTSLTNITIPDSVTSMGNGAFAGCNSLESINVSSNNQYYSSMDGVLFNKNVTTLIQYPAGKTATSYIIPDSVRSIGDSAFESCTSLTSITIPDRVTSIGNWAFSGCTSLTNIYYYRGSLEEKNKITIGSNNSYLENATWFYDSCIGAQVHSYSDACDEYCNMCGKARKISHVYDDDFDVNCNVCGGERPYTPGDTNGDNQLNAKDCANLIQYINGWNNQILDPAADVNDDGKVNVKDYVLLIRYINGWDVELY